MVEKVGYAIMEHFNADGKRAVEVICPNCGAVNHFNEFSAVEIFVCQNCETPIEMTDKPQ